MYSSVLPFKAIQPARKPSESPIGRLGHALLILLSTTVLSAGPTLAAPAKCSSYSAVYAPPDTGKYGVETSLRIQRLDATAPGKPIAKFILETRRSKDRAAVSKLTMTFTCDGEGNYCQVSFPASSGARSFPVVALGKNFTRSLKVVSKTDAPYALVFANFAEGISLTDWGSGTPAMEYASPQKQGPEPSDVWILKACD